MSAELEYYKEQLAHGRHIEVQRSTVAGIAATLSGGIIGKLLEQLPLTRNDLPYTVTLFFLGLIAFLLCGKLYERFRLHNEIAREARNVLDPNLHVLRKNAETRHKKDYPFFYWLPLHIVWNSLFVVIALLGLGTTILILCR